jgi:signal peptidase II
MAYKHSNHSLLPWLGIAVVVLLLDQLTKVMVINAMQLGGSHRITSFFNLVRWHNAGAAFSFLHNAGGWQRWFFIGLGTVAAGFIVWLLRRHGGQRMFSWALALILGGAIGNVIDRTLYGYVIDFIQVHYQGANFPAFNVADSAISIGAVLLIWDELRRVRRTS